MEINNALLTTYDTSTLASEKIEATTKSLKILNIQTINNK